MKIKKFQLATESKDQILNQFDEATQKTKMQSVLEGVESSVNDKLLVNAKTVHEAAKKHYKTLYAERAKAYLEKQEQAAEASKMRVENLVKLTMQNWLKENRVNAVSAIRAAKAQKAESLLHAIVSKFYVGVNSDAKTKIESLSEKVEKVSKENQTLHKALNEKQTKVKIGAKKMAYESAINGLTDTQKEKVKALAIALPKSLTAEGFSESMQNIRGLVVSKVETTKNESKSIIRDDGSNKTVSILRS